jgi:ClpP class serine protease
MYIVWGIFLFLLILAALQPLVRQRMIVSARVRLLRAIESKRGTRVIAMIHREETFAFFGFPLARYIDIHDSEEVLRAIKLTDPNMPMT